MGFLEPNNKNHQSLLPDKSKLRPCTPAMRAQLFGTFDFEAAPNSQNAEAINILGDWELNNIKTVLIPQLQGIDVFDQQSSGKMRFHQAAEQQLLNLWSAWEQADLLKLILTYEGSYNPRFIRGSRTKLSNHAYGSAFDINAKWNRLGAIPAAVGSEGPFVN